MAGLKPPEGGVAPPMGVPKLESVVEKHYAEQKMTLDEVQNILWEAFNRHGSGVPLYAGKPVEVVDGLFPVGAPWNPTLGLKLGHGASGHVYLGVLAGQPVAVKVLAGEVGRGEAAYELDARAVVPKCGSSLPEVYGVCLPPGPGRATCIVLEYVYGVTLERALKHEVGVHKGDKVTRVPLLQGADLLLVGHQLVEAVAALSRGGLVHRDLKPDNVMLSYPNNVMEPGAGFKVRLIDSGLLQRYDRPLRELQTDRKTAAYLGNRHAQTLEALVEQRLHATSDGPALAILLASITLDRHIYSYGMPYPALQPLLESLAAEPYAFVQSNQAHAKGLPRTDAVIGHVMWLGRVSIAMNLAHSPAERGSLAWHEHVSGLVYEVAHYRLAAQVPELAIYIGLAEAFSLLTDETAMCCLSPSVRAAAKLRYADVVGQLQRLLQLLPQDMGFEAPRLLPRLRHIQRGAVVARGDFDAAMDSAPHVLRPIEYTAVGDSVGYFNPEMPTITRGAVFLEVLQSGFFRDDLIQDTMVELSQCLHVALGLRLPPYWAARQHQLQQELRIAPDADQAALLVAADQHMAAAEAAVAAEAAEGAPSRANGVQTVSAGSLDILQIGQLLLKDGPVQRGIAATLGGAFHTERPEWDVEGAVQTALACLVPALKPDAACAAALAGYTPAGQLAELELSLAIAQGLTMQCPALLQYARLTAGNQAWLSDALVFFGMAVHLRKQMEVALRQSCRVTLQERTERILQLGVSGMTALSEVITPLLERSHQGGTFDCRLIQKTPWIVRNAIGSSVQLQGIQHLVANGAVLDPARQQPQLPQQVVAAAAAQPADEQAPPPLAAPDVQQAAQQQPQVLLPLAAPQPAAEQAAVQQGQQAAVLPAVAAEGEAAERRLQPPEAAAAAEQPPAAAAAGEEPRKKQQEGEAPPGALPAAAAADNGPSGSGSPAVQAAGELPAASLQQQAALPGTTGQAAPAAATAAAPVEGGLSLLQRLQALSTATRASAPAAASLHHATPSVHAVLSSPAVWSGGGAELVRAALTLQPQDQPADEALCAVSAVLPAAAGLEAARGSEGGQLEQATLDAIMAGVEPAGDVPVLQAPAASTAAALRAVTPAPFQPAAAAPPPAAPALAAVQDAAAIISSRAGAGTAAAATQQQGVKLLGLAGVLAKLQRLVMADPPARPRTAAAARQQQLVAEVGMERPPLGPRNQAGGGGLRHLAGNLLCVGTKRRAAAVTSSSAGGLRKSVRRQCAPAVREPAAQAAEPVPEEAALTPEQRLDLAITSEIIRPEKMQERLGLTGPAYRGWLPRTLGINPQLLSDIHGLRLERFSDSVVRGVRQLQAKVEEHLLAEMEAGQLAQVASAWGVPLDALHAALRNTPCMEDLLEVDVAALFPADLRVAVFTARKAYVDKLAPAAAAGGTAAKAIGGTSAAVKPPRRTRAWVACCDRLLSQSEGEVVCLRRALLQWMLRQEGVLRCEGRVQVGFRLNADPHASQTGLQDSNGEWLTIGVEVQLPETV